MSVGPAIAPNSKAHRQYSLVHKDEAGGKLDPGPLVLVSRYSGL